MNFSDAELELLLVKHREFEELLGRLIRNKRVASFHASGSTIRWCGCTPSCSIAPAFYLRSDGRYCDHGEVPDGIATEEDEVCRVQRQAGVREPELLPGVRSDAEASRAEEEIDHD